jgi:hypothetical protein
VRSALADRDGERILLPSKSPLTVLAPLVRWAEAGNRTSRTSSEVRRPTLEDVYLALTSEDEQTGV